MATITPASFAIPVTTLTGTTADQVTLTGTGAHKLLISNLSGTAPLYVNIDDKEGGAAAQGTLTLDTNPSDDIAAQGTLTIAEPVTDGDTFTIGDITYTLESTLTTTGVGNIFIGANEAATKVNIVAAINNSGGGGTLYSGSTKANPLVSAAAFSGDDCVLTATTPGAAGSLIATTETFTHVSNVFDATTLGATTEGTDADTMTIGGRTYTFRDELDSAASYEILIGADAGATQLVVADAVNGVVDEANHSALAANPDVTMAAFSSDDAVLTARISGTVGNAIATTETFLAGTNVFDATTLGTTTAGAEMVASAATAAADHHVVPAGLNLELQAKAHGLSQGVTMSIVGNGNSYCVQLVR